MLKGLIKGLINRFRQREYRESYIKEHGVPMFPNKYLTTNKSHIPIISRDEIGTYIEKETQLGKVVMFHKNFHSFDGYKRNYKHKGDVGFQKNGLKVGDVFEVGNMGYLGNITSYIKVILLTDKYVYLRNMERGYIHIYSYEELSRILESDSNKKLEGK